jgi:hypothetical protein
MILLVIAMSVGVSWLMGDARIPPAESLVGPETVAFTVIHLDKQDPGVNALLRTTMTRLRSAFVERQGVAGAVRSGVRAIAEQQFMALLPIQIVVTYDVLPPGQIRPATPQPVASGSPAGSGESGPSSGPSAAPSPPASPSTAPQGAAPLSPSDRAVPTFVISVGRLKGLSEFVFGSIRRAATRENATIESWRGNEILVIPSRARGSLNCVSHVRNSYILSSRVEGVRLAIDRLMSDSGAFGGSRRMAASWNLLDARQDAVGVVSADNDQIRSFLESIAAEQDSRETAGRITPSFIDDATRLVEGIAWEMDVLSEEELSIHLILDCADGPAAARVRAFIEQMGRDLSQAGLTDVPRVQVRDASLDVTLRVKHLQRVITGMTRD